MEWHWFDNDGSAQARVDCRETDCYYHDGEQCRFQWIDRPTTTLLDRGRCYNFLIEEHGTWSARINAVN